MQRREGHRSAREIRLWILVWGLPTMGSCPYHLAEPGKLELQEEVSRRTSCGRTQCLRFSACSEIPIPQGDLKAIESQTPEDPEGPGSYSLKAHAQRGSRISWTCHQKTKVNFGTDLPTCMTWSKSFGPPDL